MNKEQARDELKKTCTMIIVIGGEQRLAARYLARMQGRIVKELAVPSPEVLRAPMLLIDKIEAAIRNSKQHCHQKQETIRRLESLRDQSHRLLQQMNYSHVDKGVRRGKFLKR